jgi:putative PIN family toxin of toxin-antitoxin system
MTRIVLDTNVLVASAYNAESASRRIVEACRRGELVLIVSPSIRREYDRILPRAIRRPGLRQEIHALLDQAEVVSPAETPRVVSEDPDDDKFLAAATEGAADALITNDDHLLSVASQTRVRVLRPSAFVSTGP